MKKIMFITDLYPHKYNAAAGIFVHHQLSELSKHYQIFVMATCDKYSWAIEHSKENDITITRVYYPYWQRYFLSSLISYPLFTLPVTIFSYLRWKPDIIHVHDFRHVPELLWLKLWLKFIPKPQYLTIHNIRTHPNRLGNNPLKWFYKLTLLPALRRWTHVFTVNNRLADWIYPHGYSQDSVSVIGNGIHPYNNNDKICISSWLSDAEPNCFKIIGVGNLVPEKGFDILIKAVAALCANSYNIQLLIVGDGSERKSLCQLITTLEMQDNIHFAGILPNDTVRSLYPHFDAFVLPSYSETFGIVYIEAMYAGLPVVGIRGEGISGLFDDGVEALFAKPKDIDDLSDKMLILISNPQLCTSMGAASAKKVRKRFMMKQLIDRVREVYER
ncbi:MAG: glycosyltransferase family 4 protein [Candidatus Cloacimonetes bacterium]|nr:glycosyltransferase family 4 protein [Candidatus Cloacimonadota bacterium]